MTNSLSNHSTLQVIETKIVVDVIKIRVKRERVQIGILGPFSISLSVEYRSECIPSFNKTWIKVEGAIHQIDADL